MLRKLNSRSRRRQRGFTLVEMLTVVLIIGILMDVALPLYLNALDDAKKKTCRNNMETIANTVEAARVKNRTSDFSTFISGGVNTTTLPDLQSVPVCPAGGTYTLANGSSGSATTFQVQCSFGTGSAAHGKYEPGVDNH